MPACKAAGPHCIQLGQREAQRCGPCSALIGSHQLLTISKQGFEGLSAAYTVLQQPFQLCLLALGTAESQPVLPLPGCTGGSCVME